DEIYRGSALLASDSAGGVKHYSLDHLGSPRLISNSSGQALGTQNYSAFGFGGTSDGGMLQFTAQERDANNLGSFADLADHFHARAYDKNFGRFLGPDQLSGSVAFPQTWNRYTYVVNNPVNRVDLDGLAMTCVPVPGGESCVSVQPGDPTDFELSFWAMLRAPFKNRDAINSSVDVGYARFMNGFFYVASFGTQDMSVEECMRQGLCVTLSDALNKTPLMIGAEVNVADQVLQMPAVRGFTKHALNMAIDRDGM